MFSVEQLAVNSLFLKLREEWDAGVYTIKPHSHRVVLSDDLDGSLASSLFHFGRALNTYFKPVQDSDYLRDPLVPVAVLEAVNEHFGVPPNYSYNRFEDYIFTYDVLSLFVMWALGEPALKEGSADVKEEFLWIVEEFCTIEVLAALQFSATHYLDGDTGGDVVDDEVSP